MCPNTFVHVVHEHVWAWACYLRIWVLFAFRVCRAGESRQMHVWHQTVIQDQKCQALAVRWPPVHYMRVQDLLWAQVSNKTRVTKTLNSKLDFLYVLYEISESNTWASPYSTRLHLETYIQLKQEKTGQLCITRGKNIIIICFLYTFSQIKRYNWASPS